jgi:hypothetical protein
MQDILFWKARGEMFSDGLLSVFVVDLLKQMTFLCYDLPQSNISKRKTFNRISTQSIKFWNVKMNFYTFQPCNFSKASTNTFTTM